MDTGTKLVFGLATGLTAIFLVSVGPGSTTVLNPPNLTGPCGGCNVVLISVEPLQKEHLGVYDYYRNTTPELGRFAENATLFTSAYTTSGHTLPATMSTFTSLYPSQHRITTADSPEERRERNVVRLAEVFNRYGYRTAAYNEREEGREAGIREGFETYRDVGAQGIPHFLEYDLPRDPDRPMFLYIQSFATHTPYTSTHISERRYRQLNWTAPYTEQILQRREDWLRQQAWENRTSLEAHQTVVERYKPRLINNESYRRVEVASYDASVHVVDRMVGRVLRILEDRGMRDDTVIVFMSQHGELLGEQGIVGHSELYEEVMSIPLLVSVPGVDQVERTDAYVSSIDIAPTLLSITGIEDARFREQREGVSIFPVLQGGESPRDTVFAQQNTGDGSVGFIDVATERKYLNLASVQGVGNGNEFVFNLSTDPEETSPITEPRVVQVLREEADAFGSAVGFHLQGDKNVWPYY